MASPIVCHLQTIGVEKSCTTRATAANVIRAVQVVHTGLTTLLRSELVVERVDRRWERRPSVYRRGTSEVGGVVGRRDRGQYETLATTGRFSSAVRLRTTTSIQRRIVRPHRVVSTRSSLGSSVMPTYLFVFLKQTVLATERIRREIALTDGVFGSSLQVYCRNDSAPAQPFQGVTTAVS